MRRDPESGDTYLQTTQGEIALTTGLSRETVNKHLHVLRSSRFARHSRRKVQELESRRRRIGQNANTSLTLVPQ